MLSQGLIKVLYMCLNRAVIAFWVTCSLILHTPCKFLLLYGWILSTTGNFTCSIKGKSIILGCNRCYGLQPLMTALNSKFPFRTFFGSLLWRGFFQSCYLNLNWRHLFRWFCLLRCFLWFFFALILVFCFIFHFLFWGFFRRWFSFLGWGFSLLFLLWRLKENQWEWKMFTVSYSVFALKECFNLTLSK